MRISFIGLGKLGGPVAEVFKNKGYDVLGYDIVNTDCRVNKAFSIEECIKDRDYIFIAVPTPHSKEYDGSIPSCHLEPKDFDYKSVIHVLIEIDKHIKENQTIILISTVLPGTIENELLPFTKGRFIYNPYLIAMGSVKDDLINPEMVIIGKKEDDDVSDLIDFYNDICNEPRFEIGTWAEAECIKIFYNTFISAKLSLVNMIQDVACRLDNINVDVVTDALSRSTNRIISDAYMKAGMGDGGPCHPRDNIALRYLAKKLNLGYDLFNEIMYSREQQAKNMAEFLMKFNKPVVILGKSFKPGVELTDGSYSLLVGSYIKDVEYDILKNEPCVYLLGHRGTYNKYEFGENDIVVDPWREYPTEGKKCSIISYGKNT